MKQSNYARYTAAGGAQRTNFLNMCILEGCTDYVFEFLLTEYRNAPTKKKAIKLYDLFCAADAPYRLNCEEILPPTNRQLEGMIDLYREMRANAQQMNIVKRVLTSASRTPPKEQFDFLLPAIFRQEDNNKMNQIVRASQGTVGKPPAGSAQASFLRSWTTTARRELINAGFGSVNCTLTA